MKSLITIQRSVNFITLKNLNPKSIILKITIHIVTFGILLKRHVKSDMLYFIYQERRSDEIESHTKISSGRAPPSLKEFFSSLKFSLMTFKKTFCRGKSINITYFECVSVALVTQSSIHSAGAMLDGHL